MDYKVMHNNEIVLETNDAELAVIAYHRTCAKIVAMGESSALFNETATIYCYPKNIKLSVSHSCEKIEVVQ